MTSAYACSMSRRDHLARLLIGALSTTAAPPKRKAPSPRDIATEFTALPRRPGLRSAFLHCCPFACLPSLSLCSLRLLLFSSKNSHSTSSLNSSCSLPDRHNHHFRPVFPTFLHFFHLLFARLEIGRASCRQWRCCS